MKQLLMISILIFVSNFANASIQPAKNNSTSKDSLMIELTGKDYNSMDELTLYSEIISSYQARDLISVNGMVSTFIKRFPKSVFADSALYVMAKQSFEKKNYLDTIRSIQKMNSMYPTSKKMVSAQFLKALAYKNMNLGTEARNTFKDLMKKYPGSPEYFRADSELRLMK